MKLNLLRAVPFFLLLFSFGKLCAQIPEPIFEAEPAMEFFTKKKEILQTLLYSDETGHYALFASGKYGDGKKSIRKFTLDFQPTDYRVKLDFPKKTLEPNTIGIVTLGKNLYHFWKVRNRKSIDYFVQEIDLKSQSKKSVTLVVSLDYKNGYSTYTKSHLVKDRETTQVHLVTQIFGNQKDPVEIRIDSFDEKLNPLNTLNLSLTHPTEQFQLLSVTPYDEKKYVLVGKHHSSRNISKSVKRKEYEYFVYNLTDGEAQVLHTISPNDTHLNGLITSIKDDKLFMTGLIGKHNPSKPSSIYYLQYDLSRLQMDFEKRNRLPDTFYNYPEKRDEKTPTLQVGFRNKKREADSNYQIKDLFLNDNNETILIAEQNFFTENSAPITNGQGAITPTLGRKMFYSNDIAVFKMSKEGDFLWHSKIMKRQQWGGDISVLSFYPTFKNNTLFLFYNGNYINIENPGANFLTKNDAALMCTVINADGTFQRNVVTYYTEEYPNVVLPRLCNYKEDIGAVLYHRAPGNLKRQKFTRIILN